MAELPEFDLAGFTPYRLAVAAQRLSEQLAREYSRRFGISTPEWRVLVHLTQADNVSVRDLEARVAMEKSKASRAASRLENNGLISKQVNARDRRLIQLSLTDKGKELMSVMLPMAEQFQKDIEARLGPDLKNLESGLNALLSEGD